MSYSTQIDWEELRVFDAASLTGGYDAIGTPTENPAYKVKVVNNSNVDVIISKDGVTDIDVCPSYGFFLYEEGTVGLSGSKPAIPARTQFYLNGTAGSGNIYLVIQYIKRASM